jgi:hypothetical protein
LQGLGWCVLKGQRGGVLNGQGGGVFRDRSRPVPTVIQFFMKVK